MPRKPEPKNKRLADAIKAKGFEKQALAKKVGVTKQTISSWIHQGSKPINKFTIKRLAEELGVDVFAEGTDDE